jgi:glycosyltransferase involved in cell wall biosynthesis
VLLAHFAGFLVQFRGPLVKELVRRGYRTHVLVPDVTPQLQERVHELGATVSQVRLERTGLNPLADLRYAHEVRAALSQLRPRVVIASGIKPISYGLPEAQALNVPVRAALFAGLGATVRPHGLKQRALSCLTAPMLRRAIASTTHAATQNDDDAAFLRARFGKQLPTSTFTMPGSGVDLQHYAAAPPIAQRAVLMTARLVGEKGVREYCQAARIVRARAPDVRFVLAGFLETRAGAIDKHELERICGNDVQYVGHVPDVRPLMAQCRVLALPSYHEGRPRSVQEALAIGRPVVVTDVPGCRDCIQPRVQGLVVPARNAHALADAVLEVLSWDAHEAATRCRQYAAMRYDAHAIAGEFVDRLLQ